MDEEFLPTLFHFPSFERFIIFDLETTGLDEEAQPFQFAALKVENWKITASFNRYVFAPIEKVPYSLSLKLHLQDKKELINSAPPIEEVIKEFFNFISDFPLVAHNVRFDRKFLLKHKPDLNNPFLDSIELFFLAFPLETSYSLEEIINSHQLKKEISETLGELGFNQLHTHDALYDCVALFCLLKEAVEKLRKTASASLLHFPSPTLSQSLGIPPQDLKSIVSSLLPPPVSLQEEEIPSSHPEFSQQEVLNFYDDWIERAGREKRPSQRMMVEKIAELLDKGENGMIEAPTGTGKTLAYLIPSAFAARRGKGKVIVATYTKHLQNQALSDLENHLMGYLQFDPPLKYILLKGRGNYLCLRALFNRMEDAFSIFPKETGDDEKFLLIYLSRLIEETKDKIEDLDAIPYLVSKKFPFLSSLKENIKSDWDTCQGKYCEHYERCFFWKARKLADDADIIITNHWRLLLAKWGEPQNCNIIIDEAHNLEDAASDAFGKGVNKEDLTTIISLLLTSDGTRGLLPKINAFLGIVAERDKIPELINLPDLRQTFAIIRHLYTLIDEFGKSLQIYLSAERIPLHPLYGASLWLKVQPRGKKARAWRGVLSKFKKLNEEWANLKKLLLAIKSLLNELGSTRYADELQLVVNQLGEKMGNLYEMLSFEYEQEKIARWIEISLDRVRMEEGGIDLNNLPEGFLENPPSEFLHWQVREAPIRIDSILQEKIYQQFRSVVLTSATLRIAGKGFGFFLDRLGLDNYVAEDNLLSLPNVFNYGENVLLALINYLPNDASYKQIERFKQDVLEELASFIPFVEGRTLVLFSARDRLEWIGEKLEPILGERMLPLLWQRFGHSKSHMLREFREIEEATLMGLRSFWEGVDVPGTSLCYLILEKLPFPHPDPLTQARREDIRKRGGDEFYDYILPLTLILFKQGFGRLIRSHRDRGVVLFLDRRLRNDIATREIVLGSLPGFKRFKEIESDRKSLYKAICEHMQELFPNFPWDDKLSQIEEIPSQIMTTEEKSEESAPPKEGTFIVRAWDYSSFLQNLPADFKLAIISPADPSFSLSAQKRDIVYLPAQPIFNIQKLFEEWKEGSFNILALHPHWLDDAEIRNQLRSADAVLYHNALAFNYASTFFSPIIAERIPDIKRKFLIIPPLEEAMEGLPAGEILNFDDEEMPAVDIGRIDDVMSFLFKARENGEGVIIYTPTDGRNLEEKLKNEGFLARWGEEFIQLSQKDLLNVLILPPGQVVGRMGVKFVIHNPPVGDKPSYLVEACQAGLDSEKGFALFRLDEKVNREEIALSMFPSEKDVEKFEALVREKGEGLLDLRKITPKLWRILHLLSSAGRMEWRLIDKEMMLILLKELEDKELEEILRRVGISEKLMRPLDLSRLAEETGFPLEELHMRLRRSLYSGELFYAVKQRAILIRAKPAGKEPIRPPLKREEILQKWQTLWNWLSSIPKMEP
ncbi:DEAD/DEAH box helicase [bacterium]|nr:DEAD/DEAH box helicase [bacterium]